MAWPLPTNYPITTPYRKTSSGSWTACGWHTGVDMAAPAGTPLYAAIAGTIRHRSYGSAFGRYQFAISPSAGQPFANDEIFYAHCSERLPDGTEVQVGDYVGKVGYEGNVVPAGPAGAHLHFEYHAGKNTWSCGAMRDPKPVLDHAAGSGGAPAGGGGMVEHQEKEDVMTPEQAEILGNLGFAVDQIRGTDIPDLQARIEDLQNKMNLLPHLSEQGQNLGWATQEQLADVVQLIEELGDRLLNAIGEAGVSE